MYEPLDEPLTVQADTPPSYVNKMQGIWLFLLLPWFPFAGLSGMAFDGGKKTSAYVFVWALWTYPLVLFIASMLKRRIPGAILLPFLNVFLFLASGGSSN
jgi:hypothetical protein